MTYWIDNDYFQRSKTIFTILYKRKDMVEKIIMMMSVLFYQMG